MARSNYDAERLSAWVERRENFAFMCGLAAGLGVSGVLFLFYLWAGADVLGTLG